MPTVFTHAFVAVAAGKAFRPQGAPWKFWLLAIACSAGPDLDVGLFAYGVEYEDTFGHRGFFHSLAFAMILAVIVVELGFRREIVRFSRAWWSHTAFFFALTASHGLLDAFTNGGMGIAFFSPFNTTRYFFTELIEVSDMGLSALFRRRMAEVLWSEMRWVWLPVGLVCGIVWACRVGIKCRSPQTDL